MPVLVKLKQKLSDSKPLHNIKVGGCLHVTKETGVLIRTLNALGAEISWCGCNPLSTQDDVAASIADEGISIFASRGVSKEEYYEDIHSVMKMGPNVTIDDGADLTLEMHSLDIDISKVYRRYRRDYHWSNKTPRDAEKRGIKISNYCRQRCGN